MNQSASPEKRGGRSGLPSAGKLLKSLAAWLVLYAVAFSLYNAIPRWREAMIHHFQVVPSVWLLHFTMPAVAFQSAASSILAPGVEVKIMSGCDGAEAGLLLASAMLVFPMPWRRRWLGATYGLLLVFTLNLVRIVTLVHLAVQKPAWLEVAHLLVWQSLIVLAVGTFVLVWLDGRASPAPIVREKP